MKCKWPFNGQCLENDNMQKSLFSFLAYSGFHFHYLCWVLGFVEGSYKFRLVCLFALLTLCPFVLPSLCLPFCLSICNTIFSRSAHFFLDFGPLMVAKVLWSVHMSSYLYRHFLYWIIRFSKNDMVLETHMKLSLLDIVTHKSDGALSTIQNFLCS